MLAFNVNLMTHYTRGKLFIKFFYKVPFYIIISYFVSLTVLCTITYILYLVFEEGTPFFNKVYNSVYLIII